MLLPFLLFVLGLVLLVGGAELLVRNAALLAVAVGISPLVVGLTVVAFGTSAPELAITLQSTLAGTPDLALGNVVGSNIANLLLVLGIAALISPLTVAPQIIRMDIPIMIGVSLLLWLLVIDQNISQLDGVLLVGGLIVYTVFTIVQSRRANASTQEAYADEYRPPRRKTALQTLMRLALIGVGLALLVFGAQLLVDSAVTFATYLGLSELVIGLTVVAIGTSLPEIAASVVAGLRGERDIAIGNVVGSCIFNILSVLGFTALVAPDGIAVSIAAFTFDIPVMVAVSVACLPIAFNDRAILRWEGALFLGYYAAYTLYLMLDAGGHDALPVFSNVMLLFVIPLTIVTLLVVFVRKARAAQSQPG